MEPFEALQIRLRLRPDTDADDCGGSCILLWVTHWLVSGRSRIKTRLVRSVRLYLGRTHRFLS